MLIYNTLSGKKEDITALKKRLLRLFVCGPTVYDYSHLGHARTYLMFDVLVNYLRHRGFAVNYLQNITDIDDKIIERAHEERRDPQRLARFFEKAYYQDMRALGVKNVSRYARASDFIEQIQNQILRLTKKGYAYLTKNGVYFSVKKSKDYGKLSRQNLEALRPGWRVEADPEKKDPLDFALWKFKKYPYEPSWPSPWGEGRPGWHIEDTAIAEADFARMQYELHGGAVDLKFPHHESEIAQAEAISGKKPYVKIWMHTGFLMVDDEKMSKSLGNFITIRDFLKNYPPAVLRMAFLKYHYRSPINYNHGVVLQAANTVNSVSEFVSKLNLVKKNGRIGAAVADKIKAAKDEFLGKMDDDFNTAEALATIFKLIGSFQSQLLSLNTKEAAAIKLYLKERLKILGIDASFALPPPEIRRIASAREQARVKRDFSRADRLRKKIESLGYIIEDTPLGPAYWKNVSPV